LVFFCCFQYVLFCCCCCFQYGQTIFYFFSFKLFLPNMSEADGMGSFVSNSLC
jgi:hypothetical protein